MIPFYTPLFFGWTISLITVTFWHQSHQWVYEEAPASILYDQDLLCHYCRHGKLCRVCTVHEGYARDRRYSYLKVHKIENFFASDFGIWDISLLVMSKYKILHKIFLIGPLLGEVRFFRVVLELWGMKKDFELGQKKFFFLSSIMDPKYDPILVFWNSIN